MRVLLSAIGSRGDIEPLVGLAVQLRALGTEVRICAPQPSAERLAEVGVPMVPTESPRRSSTADGRRDMAEFIAGRFATITAATEGCDAVVAAGLREFATRSVAEKLGIRYVYAGYCPAMLPSPHHPPLLPVGTRIPVGMTDNLALWDLGAQHSNARYGPALNAHRESIGLPPVDNVTDHILTDHPWLAADPVLGPWPEPADLKVVQTGAWIVPDERPLSAELEAFLDAGAPPVYVGFGDMRVPGDVARVAIEVIRAQGYRALIFRGRADLAPIDDRDDCFAVGEVNQQALFGRVAAVVHHGGAGTTTTAARAGAPQVVIPPSTCTDEPYWAGRVAELGIGVAHDGPAPTAESLSCAIRTALLPEIRARAAAIAGTIRTDGAMVAAALLVDAVKRGKPSAFV